VHGHLADDDLQPLSGVRKSRPSVPSRFSVVMALAVRYAPVKRLNTNPAIVRQSNTAMPRSWVRMCGQNMPKVKARMAAMPNPSRKRHVSRRREAPSNSRWMMG